MADKGMIFSPAMVRALLDGRKTQTRRLLRSVHYAPGDRVWVREGVNMGFSSGAPICRATYIADGAALDLTPPGAVAWAERQTRDNVSPMFCPRWASRLTLTVTDVRVQRVQEISTDDVRAEGVEPGANALRAISPSQSGKQQRDAYHRAHVQPFAALWDNIHGPDAWERNDWVCALTFSVERRNIDAGPA